MSMRLFELKREWKRVHDQKEQLLVAPKAEGRTAMNDTERADYQAAFAREGELQAKIQDIESRNTIRQFDPIALLDAGLPSNAPGATRRGQKQMSTDYNEAFLNFVRSGGKQASRELSEGFDPLFGGFALPALPGMSAAAMYEGSNAVGGYSVSVPTDNQIVPLGVPDLGVRSVARVIPTATDIKIPTQSTFGTAGLKAESGGSTNSFSESDPTLSQFTLSAWMMGLTHTVSWELLQDVSMFQEFGIRDLINAVDIAEDGYFVTGTGTSQPQGLIGNVGTGTGSAYAVESTGAYLLQAVLDVQGTLKAQYFPGASFLMSRATATAIRKAQQQSNLYAPVWTRENGRDRLHGYPVVYSGSMPALPTATTSGVTPILFGDFATGYIIGDRGGSGTFVKILDQPLATSGQTILLGYKRVDGRVRRSEAIQGISISHS